MAKSITTRKRVRRACNTGCKCPECGAPKRSYTETIEGKKRKLSNLLIIGGAVIGCGDCLLQGRV